MTATHAQPRLDTLGKYPFERLSQLLQGKKLNPDLAHIDAGAGEPRLPLPGFAQDVLLKNMHGFSRYPATGGNAELCQAIATWLMRRYGLRHIDAGTQVLSANGTREALFAAAHALVNPESAQKPYVLMPNPMYQIYYGAAILAGGEPYFMPCTEHGHFAPDLNAVPQEVWAKTAVIYVCSPSNPTGWIASKAYYEQLLQLADTHDFYILADECYSEIYREQPPTGLLEVCQALGRGDYARCMVFNSLSKRSAMPGLRSGFIAGDANMIARFKKLRSYTGPATPLPLQAVAAAAWNDEQHVQQHLAGYQQSLQAFGATYGCDVPDGSFFIWLPVGNGEAFAVAAYEQQSITVLPGAYLSITDANGINPGQSYVRVALLDGPEASVELAQRLKAVRV